MPPHDATIPDTRGRKTITAFVSVERHGGAAAVLELPSDLRSDRTPAASRSRRKKRFSGDCFPPARLTAGWPPTDGPPALCKRYKTTPSASPSPPERGSFSDQSPAMRGPRPRCRTSTPGPSSPTSARRRGAGEAFRRGAAGRPEMADPSAGHIRRPPAARALRLPSPWPPLW